jgi:hypothetical protein
MTIAEWPDRESFERAFYAPAAVAALEEDLKRLHDPVFLISEVLTSSEGGSATGVSRRNR